MHTSSANYTYVRDHESWSVSCVSCTYSQYMIKNQSSQSSHCYDRQLNQCEQSEMAIRLTGHSPTNTSVTRSETHKCDDSGMNTYFTAKA